MCSYLRPHSSNASTWALRPQHFLKACIRPIAPVTTMTTAKNSSARRELQKWTRIKLRKRAHVFQYVVVVDITISRRPTGRLRSRLSRPPLLAPCQEGIPKNSAQNQPCLDECRAIKCLGGKIRELNHNPCISVRLCLNICVCVV